MDEDAKRADQAERRERTDRRQQHDGDYAGPERRQQDRRLGR